MYDSIILRAGGAYLEYVPPLLTGLKEHQKDGSYYVSGSLRNGQQIWVHSDTLYFKGSLPKFHLGDNIKSIGRADTQRAIEDLSDALKIDFSAADVTRLDVGLTIPTIHQAAAYYPLMGASERYTRSIFKNSLYYKVATREKSLYDKYKDAKAKGMIIPDFLINTNLTRFEIRYLKSILHQLNRASLIGADIYQEVFYMQMLDNWLNEYQNIRKLTFMQIDKSTISKPSDLANQIVANLLQASGVDIVAGVDELFNQAKQLKVFDGSKNPSRDLARAKETIYNMLSSGVESELMQELDSKFTEHIKFYR